MIPLVYEGSKTMEVIEFYKTLLGFVGHRFKTLFEYVELDEI